MAETDLYRKSVARAAALILLRTGCVLYDPDHTVPFRITTAPLRDHPADALRLMEMMSDLPEHDETSVLAPLLTLTSWQDILEVMHLNDFGDRVMRHSLAAYVREPHKKTRDYMEFYDDIAQAV